MTGFNAASEKLENLENLGFTDSAISVSLQSLLKFNDGGELKLRRHIF